MPLMFTREDHNRVRSGEITVTWRLWKYQHVKAGRPYATGFGHVFVEDVRVVRAADVTDDDAHEVGLPDVDALYDQVREHTGATVSPDTTLYRVQFNYLEKPPEKPVFSLEEIDKRLDRLDRASPRGPWTMTALRLIEESPGVVSTSLNLEAGIDRPTFKLNVRKLKALGLTLSLEVGYELSELGQSYLDSKE
jgi:hypothetical protein